MQQLYEIDLCGYLLSQEPKEWTVLSMPCIMIDDDGEEKALWEHKHTLEELRKIRENNKFVFDESYKENKEYKAFIEDLIGYLDEGENKHRKDAIDICCSAASALKIKYASFLYG